MTEAAARPIKVAVVEDDPEIRDLVVGYLTREGFEAAACEDGAAFDALRARMTPDLVVLDLMMPGEDGLSICRRVAHELPVLVLSAKGEDVDRIIGLEVGADDYLPKPFNPRELVARIRAVLRRRAQAPAAGAGAAVADPDGPRQILTFQGWRLDVDGRGLEDPSGAATALSSGEMTLLIAFAQRPNRVLSRDLLLDETRGRSAEPFDRAIDVQVSRLRRKLAAAGGGDLIRTVRGDGYLFAADVRRAAS
ncbi:MAG: response regulator [Pseudomonadota bacterium]